MVILGVVDDLYPNPRPPPPPLLQASGLALPGSDLDVVILGVVDDLERPAEGFSTGQRKRRDSSRMTHLA